MRLLNNGESKSFACDNGLGTGAKDSRIYAAIDALHGSVLVMHSGGVKTHWNHDDYPVLPGDIPVSSPAYYIGIFEENATLLRITPTSFWRRCGSAGSFCWAKVGKAKLIANPTKRIFIVSSREFRMVRRRRIWSGFRGVVRGKRNQCLRPKIF